MSSSDAARSACFFVALLALACGGAGSAKTVAPDGAAPSAPAKPEPATELHRTFVPDGSLFLSAIPAHVSERATRLVAKSASDDEFARGLRVRVEVMSGYKNLGELTRRSKIPLVNGTFQISDVSKLGSSDAPSKGDQKSSFVIDYDQPSFAAPVAELEKSGKADSPAGISAFADRYIAEKTYARSFDVASRVALTHAGDCTEHAVFTTALLRRFGFKARVILGIVLAGVHGPEVEPQVLAFGHAWVEQHAAKRWQIVDAALGGPERERTSGVSGLEGAPPGTRLRLVYLPITVLRDESASYGRALMDQVGVESVVQVDVDVNERAVLKLD
ncbi:MAG TPA: transglutaminase domain-containing protein [Polyangiaceae bacterium]